MMKEKTRHVYILIAVIIVAVTARLWVATLGYNHDFRSYLRVGKFVSEGANVYAASNRYNYAPLFSVVQGTLFTLSSGFSDPTTAYRIFIILFLTTFDIALGVALYRIANVQTAALFLLNPITIIITGYHNQFDNVAVFFAFCAARMADSGPRFTAKDITAICLLSLSLIVKHLLFIFPVWILLMEEFPIRKKIAYAVLPLLLFAASFIPYIDGGWEGIVKNVFLYSSKNNFPLLSWLFQWLFDRPRVFYRPVFISLMLAIGWFSRRKSFEDLLLIYLITLVSVSSAIANQYLAIPVLSLCLSKDTLRYLYFGLASVFLILSHSGLRFVRFFENSFLANVILDSGYTVLTMILFAVLVRQLSPLCSLKDMRKQSAVSTM